MVRPIEAYREAGVLPPDDPLRLQLHNELHARPTPHIRLPALVLQVAVRHEGVSREVGSSTCAAFRAWESSSSTSSPAPTCACASRGARCAGSGTPSSAPTPWYRACRASSLAPRSTCWNT